MAGCGGQDLPVWASLPLSPTTHIHASTVFLINGGDQEAGGAAALTTRLQALLKAPPPASLFRSSSSTASLRGAAAAQARRPNARWALLAALLLVGLLGFVDVQGGLQRALARARGGAPAPPIALDFPVQSCCIGEQCVRNARGRHAVVTHVHSQREVTQLQRLEASVRATNPGVDVAVMLVRGELGAAPTQRLLASKVTIFYVEPLRDPWGAKARPASANWLKLRAFGLTQYDAVLLVDPSQRVAGDLAPLFALPTDFAAGWDQARWLGSNGSAVDAVAGGGLFLRPCATTEAHMLDVLHRQRQPPRAPVLGFGQQLARQAAALTGQPYDEQQDAGSAQQHRLGGASQQRRQQEQQQQGGGGGGDLVAVGAEQEFLAWYFQYTGMTLPFDVYVINMDGAENRLAAFQRTFEASDLHIKNFVRFPAVNGSALDAGRLVTPKASKEIALAETHGYRTKHYQLTRGSLGCYMSHLQLYQHIIRGDSQYAFVFEDDAVIRRPGLLAALIEAKPYPEDWDLIMLGHSCHECPPVPGAPAYRAAHAFFGTHAYVVHRRGLQKIFAYPRLYPIEKQIDAVLGDMSSQGLLNVYALAQPLVDQNSRQFKTTIQVPVKWRLGVDAYARE